MKLQSIKFKNRKRVGRGLSAGQGKTAGRGYKGQKSRAGFDLPKRFEGGQTSLGMRLPKLPGFKSHKRKNTVISLDAISRLYKAGETVDFKTLYVKRLISKNDLPKILNTGELTVAVKLGDDIKVSASVKELFEKQSSREAEKPSAEIKAEKLETKSSKLPKIPKEKPTTKPKKTVKKIESK